MQDQRVRLTEDLFRKKDFRKAQYKRQLVATCQRLASQQKGEVYPCETTNLLIQCPDCSLSLPRADKQFVT
jgi:hypothetical protein